MVSKKYVKDYKFSETLTEKGRIKTEAVYTGSMYAFSDRAAAVEAGKTIFIMLCAAWLVFLGALVPETHCSKVMYVLLPYAFLALPLGSLTEKVFAVGRAEESFIRSKADGFDKIPSVCTWGIVLSGLSVIGTVIEAFVSGELFKGTDVLFVAAEAALMALCVFIKTRGEVFSTHIL